MTKSPERGRSDITDEAQHEAKRTRRDVCVILEEMFAKAKRAKDKARQRKIVRAQKFLGCRNKRKRESSS